MIDIPSDGYLQVIGDRTSVAIDDSLFEGSADGVGGVRSVAELSSPTRSSEPDFGFSRDSVMSTISTASREQEETV